MTEEELLRKIHYYSKRLGMISYLAFKKEGLEDVLEELIRLDQICIQDYERNTL